MRFSAGYNGETMATIHDSTNYRQQRGRCRTLPNPLPTVSPGAYPIHVYPLAAPDPLPAAVLDVLGNTGPDRAGQPQTWPYTL